MSSGSSVYASGINSSLGLLQPSNRFDCTERVTAKTWTAADAVNTPTPQQVIYWELLPPSAEVTQQDESEMQ